LHSKWSASLCGRDDDIKQAIATKLIALAKAGERNPDILCEEALRDIRRPQQWAASEAVRSSVLPDSSWGHKTAGSSHNPQKSDIAAARCEAVEAALMRLRLIEKHGRKGNMMKWREQLNGDCPRRDAHSLQERCDLICPDLPKVL
jgi:hypothetical protein